MKEQTLEQPCKGQEAGSDSICFYVKGLCEDRMIDFDLFLDPIERKRWKEIFEFRRDNLHLSVEKANAWTIATIKRDYQMKYGAITDPRIPQIALEFTIAATPLTPKEEDKWNESIAFRTRMLGTSRQQAIEWTTRNIEMGRQLSAQVEL